jgi:hypothetical protein
VSPPKIDKPFPVHGKPIREWEEDTLDRLLKTFEKLRKEGVIPRPSLADEEKAAELKATNRLN